MKKHLLSLILVLFLSVYMFLKTENFVIKIGCSIAFVTCLLLIFAKQKNENN